MRNLKRALSLGLTAAMISGLMVMGSSAASYADVTSEDNQEAIEVLQAVEIMVGDENGDFNPDQNVTRNEMAVIMANLMEYNVASYKNTSPFTDVPAWAEPYVAACWTNGITAGYSDTIYGGSDTVTTAQAALMLMKALGYFQYASDFGSDWQLATTRQGNAIDLFVGVDSGVTQAMTRNDVAQLVLNTLEAGTVQASTDGSWSIGDVVINNNVTYNYITSNQTYARAIDDDRTTNNDGDLVSGSIVELGEQLYMGDLKLDKNTTDVFGRPSRTWSFGGNEIGTYAQKNLMVAEYTTAVTGKDLYDVIGKTAFDNYEFESYVDGAESDLYEEISRNNKDDVSETGNGALTQVFVDTDNKAVTVTVINTYLADAEDDYNEKKEEVSFEVHGLGKILDVSAEDFAIEDVVEGDFALVTYSYESDEIESISGVEILSGVTITRFTSNDTGNDKGTEVSSVTADGTKYDASNTLTYEADTLNNYTNGNLKDKTYNVYLDQYGYAIGVEEVEAANNYLFLTGINGGKDYLATANFDANVIFLDGTSEVIKVKNNAAIRKAIEDASSKALVNTWFKFTKNSSDVYTLTAIASALSKDVTLAQNHVTKAQVDKIDDRHISLVGSLNERIYGTEDTVYLVAGLDTVTVDGEGSYGVIADADEVIVGVDNTSIEVKDWQNVADDLSDKNTTLTYNKCVGGTYALYDDDGVVIAAVVVGESEGSASSVAYVISEKASEEGYENGEWIWTRDVVINGEVVTLNEVSDEDESVLADEMVKGQWYTVKFDADGNVKKVTDYNATTEADKYADDFAEAVTELRKEDLVVLEMDETRLDYSKNGRTLYDWNNKTQDAGIFTIQDVKFVIRQENKNKVTTEEYTGWNRLTSALDTLNEDPNHYYDFSAVIENGRITSVVIEDLNPDNDFDRPDGGTSGTGLVEKVTMKDDSTITVVDRYNAGKTVEELATDWAADRGIKNIEFNGTSMNGVRDGRDVFYSIDVVTAYKVAVNYATSIPNVDLTGSKEVWAASTESLTVNVTAKIKSGMAGSFGDNENITVAPVSGETTGSVTHVSTSADQQTASFTFNVRSNPANGNNGAVTVTY